MADNLGKIRSRLKDLPQSERPQERLEKLGPRALSDRELLAMLLRSGTPSYDVLALASSIIEKSGSLAGLARWDASDFQRLPGIGRVKALQLTVHMEIAQRMSQGNRLADLILDEPKKVWNLISLEALPESVEKIWVLCLDRKNRLLRSETISSGTATSSLVHPREVFRPAIRWGASAVILAHNHPSGDPTPSPSDLQVTRKILDASKCVDIDLHDHVIIGEQGKCPNDLGYYSFSENGYI